MALEIIVDRDPDGDTTLFYFKDGVLTHPDMLGITEYHVDPGASDADKEWVEGMEEDAKNASPIAAGYIRAIVKCYTS